MPATLVPPLILASASPRRRALLAGLGLRFEVVVPDVDETPEPGEAPAAMVVRLASAKAAAVLRRGPAAAVLRRGPAAAVVGGDPAAGALVIAADTTVVIDGASLAKPADVAETAAFLRRLSGRSHLVHTGHALRWGDREVVVLRTTTVRFRSLEAFEIEAYAASGEGLDKAGGYAIQGLGATLVDGIDGCYGAVVGLSLPAVVLAARSLGVRLV